MGRIVLLILVLFFAALACQVPFSGDEVSTSSKGDEAAEVEVAGDEDNSDIGESVSGEPVELNCEDFDLPCTVEEADPAALERGNELLTQLKSRLKDGESIEDAVAWMEGQDGVRMVLSNPYGLMFVPEGGLPLAVYDAVAAGGLEPIDSTSKDPVSILSMVRLPYAPPQDIVGEGTSRENDKRLKKALILSPFEFEYNIVDAGDGAAKILGQIRDYKGRVKHMLNEDVGVSAFNGWDQYDLIMLNTHGGPFDGTDGRTGREIRTTMVVTGDRQTDCTLNTLMQTAGAEGEYQQGVGCVSLSIREENFAGRAEDSFADFLYVNPLYFIKNYPSGLEKAVIVFNGCKTYRSDFLPSKLAGNSSVFFGWDNNVLSSFNPVVMDNLFTQLAEGLPTEKAFDEACGSGGCVDNTRLKATLQRYAGGDDLRIRDLAVPLHPFTGEGLEDKDRVPIYGYPGDGNVDEMPFFVEVVGVEFERIQDFSIRFEVNGQEINGSWQLDDPDAVEKWESEGAYTYRILDRMTLPFDFKQNQAINLQVIIDLPEEGESKSVKVEPIIRNPVLAMDTVIVGEGPDGSLSSHVTADVPLSLVEIKDEQVEFESIEQPDTITYEAFEAIIPNCEVSPFTEDGIMTVPEAIFPKDRLTNKEFTSPERVRLYVSKEANEWLSATCNGVTVSMPRMHYWQAGFNIINENYFVKGDEGGLVYTNWSGGNGDVYAEFTTRRTKDEFDGKLTYQIREP